MQTKDSRKIDWIGTVLLYMAPMFSVGIYCMLLHKTVIDAFSNIVLALILVGGYFTFLHVNRDYFYQKISHKLLYFGSFFLSFVLLGAGTKFPVGVFWMAAVVIAALGCGIELAIATQVVLMVQYTLLLLPQDNGFYRFSGYLLLGIVIALLFSILKGMDAIPYLALILAACDGILQFVVYHFNLALMQDAVIEITVEIVSVLVFALAGAGYLRVYGARRWAGDENREADKIVEQAVEDSGILEEEVSQNDELLQKELIRLKQLTASDFELLIRLQSYSQSLMLHSQKIGELSEKAAAAIGGNAVLAKAGGLYHEIGRMEDENDYIEAGTRIGQEYDFPDSLLAVMRQHSTGFEFPKSAEAAVVMLSDCIISTSEYLEKSGKRNSISDEQLVYSIFQNRLEKGNLEHAGMTSEQIQSLREFYAKNTFIGGQE